MSNEQQLLFNTTEKEKPARAEPVRKAKPTKATVTPAKLKEIPRVTAERKLELAKIFEDRSKDWAVHEKAAEEAARPYMRELEEASEDFDAAGLVLRRQEDDGCIRTVVFSLNRNNFHMSWTPYTDDAQKEGEFFEKKTAKREQELKDKLFPMGLFLLRHKYEPFGLFCISMDEAEEADEPGEPIIWRFAFGPGYTSADQEFLETVARAMWFAPFADGSSPWRDWCVEIDFWKREDGTFSFHFVEYVVK